MSLVEQVDTSKIFEEGGVLAQILCDLSRAFFRVLLKWLSLYGMEGSGHKIA